MLEQRAKLRLIYSGHEVTLAKEEHTRKLACKGVFFFRQDSCEAALYINLSLATTYIGIPAFAGIPMREIDFYI